MKYLYIILYRHHIIMNLYKWFIQGKEGYRPGVVPEPPVCTPSLLGCVVTIVMEILTFNSAGAGGDV